MEKLEPIYLKDKDGNIVYYETDDGKKKPFETGEYIRSTLEQKTINILGTEWKIITCKEEDSVLLNGKYRDGCTDNSTRTIYICEKKDDCELQDYEMWKKLSLRHEIFHAFLFESGLDSSSVSTTVAWATNEEMIDWFAIQSPKIFKVFQELDIL